MATEVLSTGGSRAIVEEPLELTKEARFRRIASYRMRLRAYPNDPPSWVDLAREYTALGHRKSALSAIRVALGLAPTSRFVLRCASRFFLHARDPEQAHHILLNSPGMVRDPWLLAAEIVAAGASGRSSRLVSRGVRLLEAEQSSPRHLSELASAIGTLEHMSGNRRKVRKYFAQALRDPTENALAQAMWLARHMTGIDLPQVVENIPRAFEAKAWEAARSGEFGLAVDQASRWLRDEPFATRSALFGSFVAATALGEFQSAIDLIETGLSANPSDPRLLAQLVYCQASSGLVEAAEGSFDRVLKALKSFEGHRSASEWEVILSADKGLIAYRRGRIEEGRKLYKAAIDCAQRNQLIEHASSAMINATREEVLAGGHSHLNRAELQRALAVFPPVSRQVIGEGVKRIETLIEAKSVGGR